MAKKKTTEEPDELKPQVAPTDVLEADSSNDVPAKDEVLKTPVFFGCEDPEVLQTLKDALGDKYEIAVMNSDVLQKSKEVWFMGKLSVHEQMYLQKIAQDKEREAEFLTLGEELRTFFPDTFRHYDLKNYFRQWRRGHTNAKHGLSNVSNRDVRNVIDGLGVYNFLKPVNPEANYEKREFVICIDDTNRLRLLNKSLLHLNEQKESYELLIGTTEQEIADISTKLSDTTELDAATAPVETKGKRKKAAPKKATKKEAVNSNGELKQTTEHLNDRCNDDNNDSRGSS